MNDEVIEALCWICSLAGGAYMMLTFVYVQTGRTAITQWGLY
ncbi:hypothetical protein [Marinomonas sp. GJ51-6]|nr:hypothetical protein [Marinomonas sp. GJ51-6]WOD08100.1 hypothetical protein ONZ50_02770 [Marinomonas sp. GJ51-6]